jgi:hypothetical protein
MKVLRAIGFVIAVLIASAILGWFIGGWIFLAVTLLVVLAFIRPELVGRMTGSQAFSSLPSWLRATPKRFAALVAVLVLPLSSLFGLASWASTQPRPAPSQSIESAAPAATGTMSRAEATATPSTKPAAQATAVPTMAQPTPTIPRPPTATSVPRTNTPLPPTATPLPHITAEEWQRVLTDPDAYKGRPVTIGGRVFVSPERDRQRVAFQVFTTNDGGDGNTIVNYAQSDFKIDKDQYVRVEGIVRGKLEGRNAFGAQITAPVIDASKVEVVGRAEAIAPAYETVQVGKTITQHGLAVTLVKVELSTKETRAHFKVKNGSQAKASAYDHSAVVVQDGRQIKRKLLFNSGYAEIDDTLQPGTESEGIIVFEPINQHVHAFKIVWDGVRTDNFRLDFADYAWDVAW